MSLLTVAFVGCLVAAHILRGGAEALSLELSFFREGESWLVGYLLFGILFAQGTMLIRRLVRDPNEEASYSIYCGVFGLLIIVAATSSTDPVHLIASLAILGLLFLLYACVLNERGHPWLRWHLLTPFAFLAVPPHGCFGSWEKAMILYLVLLINGHYHSLAPPERRKKVVRPRRRHRRKPKPSPLSVFVSDDEHFRPWRRLRIRARSTSPGR
jgi:hypothetical protein